MKLITRDTDYALRALSFISRQKNEIVTVSELTRQLKIPGPFLRKILQLLNKKGVLKSLRGAGGGFLLGKPASKIFLTDLMEIFQGPIHLNECFFRKSLCSNTNTCLLRKKISSIEKYVISELRSVSVSSFPK